MACSAQQSRINGAKSQGATSERGKAIARHNSVKHGLLATKPPTLLTEDRQWFDDMMASLVEKYQPNDPIEHLLIERIAMGWLRLRRLWGVEAALGDVAILKIRQRLSTKASELERRRIAKQLGDAEISAAGLSLSGEQLGRYERIITLQLNDAIEKLEEIKREQRELAASMGSSGITQFICDRLRYGIDGVDDE
ncbi:hypothetical protein H6F50_09015 [Coleofasciculus sp. FACHB-712]|uniref:hypothetical protein n=1 Tax=Coleofasciculus sp. FACHB-712 TaxID=2692789 RepID=UPI0016834C01|nr:hypothetical protein [Coleofasciculus sp. FACHB-712]MBD1942493.1 hypothetical protein [Coleofasciculus sp. FACHB-712]